VTKLGTSGSIKYTVRGPVVTKLGTSGSIKYTVRGPVVTKPGTSGGESAPLRTVATPLLPHPPRSSAFIIYTLYSSPIPRARLHHV